eukprot:258717-Rhodomonas_salina.3
MSDMAVLVVTPMLETGLKLLGAYPPSTTRPFALSQVFRVLYAVSGTDLPSSRSVRVSVSAAVYAPLRDAR